MPYFITDNPSKLAEIKAIMPEVKGLGYSLPEIQEIDPYKIVSAKLQSAFSVQPDGEFFVEDTSLYLDALNGLPGPLVKWFLAAIGPEGLHKISYMYGNARATAKTIIGYCKDNGEVKYFEGAIAGDIVAPRGTNGFGWDSIFQPDGQAKTFAEMTFDEKNAFNMRRLAVEKLRDHLAAQSRLADLQS